MDPEGRGGRGDRMGRYYNSHYDHHFRDMDYRGYGQDEEDAEAEYHTRIDEGRPYIHNEASLDILPGSREGNWGCGGTRLQMDHNIRHQEEHRFSYVTGMRKAFAVKPEEHGCSSDLNLSQEELEQRDQDYRADLDCQKPSNIIMLRLLPPNATANEIRAILQEQRIQPKEVRLMRNKSSGQSRGFAFVEFNLIQEATGWMETNQGLLFILGHRVSMHYSNPKPRGNEDWLCNKCGVQNFKRRERCFKCSAPKSEAELKLPQSQKDFAHSLKKEEAQGLLPLPAPFDCSGLSVHPGQVTQHADGALANDTLILRNLGPHTSVEAILSSLSSFATLSPSNIRLIKDKQTHLNRGFAFLQLATIVEASQLLQILQALQPPLSIDGKVTVVEFAKGSKRDVFLTDGNKVSAATVASTAIAAAQWAVTQAAQNGSGGGQSTEYTELYPQRAAVKYSQGRNDYSVPNGLSTLACPGTPIMGGSAGQTTPVIPSLTPGVALVQQRPLNAPAAVVKTASAKTVSQVEIVGKPIPAGCSQPATPGTEHELQQYPLPDVSTYQYDESSGYYYDPLTGLYYDPNSQYYYNPHTQHFMYWEGEKHTYVPAPSGQSNTEGAPTGDCAVPIDSTLANHGSKEKKDKPKSKTAQQIAKDMERWAKTLNRHKENMRSVSSSPAAGSTDRRESASADAGYAVLEKKGALLERPQMFLDQLRQTESSPPQPLGLVPAYSGESDSEEEGVEKDEKEGRLTDWVKMACLLCRRQFPSKEALIRHQQLSELHKQNMEHRRMQEAADKESQRHTDGLEPPDFKKRRLNSIDAITGSSLGARMLQGGVKRELLLRKMQME
ncbi:RNA-binding protein 10 isoform X1 [Entelurus aequoreus]|uniref:RNA-binding protein 10 isoform X1 n=1 Tax=Entelurus aequoreus TaxID=161455 RepID=UPI002B1D487E|nr:RNA-binding protein 10 isoform X1 [Entelurus aequoreus]